MTHTDKTALIRAIDRLALDDFRAEPRSERAILAFAKAQARPVVVPRLSDGDGAALMARYHARRTWLRESRGVA